MTPQAAANAQYLRTNFEAYCLNCVKIRTRDGLEPFKLNPVQKRLLKVCEAQYAATGKVRVIILKGRQQGISTFASAYIYWKTSLTPAKKGLVVAHKAKSTSALFDMYKRINQYVPKGLKPKQKLDSSTDMSFPGIDSRITVETAGGQGIGRGETLNYVHVSEMGYWDPVTGHANWGGLKAAVPNVKDTVVFIESTAQGMNNIFYDLWQASDRGETEFHAFFSPWFDSIYDVKNDVPADFASTLTFEELDLINEYGLTYPQLLFRRHTIAENTKDGKSGRAFFKQEYPSTKEEAFQHSGRPVFDAPRLVALDQKRSPLIRTMSVREGAVVEDPTGWLSVYRDHERGQMYTIGADVAHGQREGDFSVAQILDGDKRQVAVWRGQINPHDFASVLEVLGKYYNNALIAVENNDAGLLTATRLGRDLRYQPIYTDVREGNINDVTTTKYGFRTTEQTKPLIIDGLAHSILSDDIFINDPITLKELQNYIFTERGKMQAAGSAHDDCVMSLAIANHVHRRNWKPIEVHDDFYVATYY